MVQVLTTTLTRSGGGGNSPLFNQRDPITHFAIPRLMVVFRSLTLGYGSLSLNTRKLSQVEVLL
jgi:hypothetical protein